MFAMAALLLIISTNLFSKIYLCGFVDTYSIQWNRMIIAAGLRKKTYKNNRYFLGLFH